MFVFNMRLDSFGHGFAVDLKWKSRQPVAVNSSSFLVYSRNAIELVKTPQTINIKTPTSNCYGYKVSRRDKVKEGLKVQPINE